MHLGQLLKRERESQNLTQKKIAKILNVTQQNIAYWEKKPILNIEIIQAYTKVLNCELQLLLVKRQE